MTDSRSTTADALAALAERVAAAGANLTLEAPGIAPIALGADPTRTRVVMRTDDAVAALLRGDHLRLGEAYLGGDVDIEGDLRQVMFVTDQLDLGHGSRLRQALVWARFVLDSRRFNRASIAHHYDRPPDFFLRWLDPSRSYTHGFYESPDDDLAAAERRKLQYAIDALGLRPGMHAFDMGCGWGSFLEHAGAQGIHVHGITLSGEQHEFVSDRITARGLPCSVERVDFLDYRPARTFDGAVFMGSLEHMPDYRYMARFLARHVAPGGRVYADFVTTREGRLAGAFLRKYIFPGVSGYVELDKLIGALGAEGFNVHEVGDDTLSCAWTVRDWARALERARGEIAERHGERAVRAFLLYLWSSHHFLAANRTQAYHVVAGRTPAAPLPARPAPPG